MSDKGLQLGMMGVPNKTHTQKSKAQICQQDIETYLKYKNAKEGG